MAREAPRRLSGALGEALVVVRLAEEAVAVPVGALVHWVFDMELLPWCHGGGGLPRVGVCAHSQGPGRCARRCARNYSLPNYFSPRTSLTLQIFEATPRPGRPTFFSVLVKPRTSAAK